MLPGSDTLREPQSPTDIIGPGSDLARYFVSGAKPEALWSLGVELEIFGFTSEQLARIDSSTIQDVLMDLSDSSSNIETESGYVTEATVTLSRPTGRKIVGGGSRSTNARGNAGKSDGRVTLEPGGQIEFSGEPCRSLSQIERALLEFAGRLKEIGERRGLLFVMAGFDPVRRLDEQKWIPKRRYDIMRPYLATRGRRAWDMMSRTAAIQVNLDYADREDLGRKFMLATRMAPVAAAIFANSPFEEGGLSGYKSTRGAAWLETDADRTGPAPPAFDDSFSIERFVEYVASVPMLFVRRAGQYLDYRGHSFSEFLSGCGCPETPIFQDFTDQLSTIFTEARLKPHIEQRSMDSGSIELTMAAIAFWKGLLYHADTLSMALDLTPKLAQPEFIELQTAVSRNGLEARIGSTSVKDLARTALDLARQGLASVAPQEASYLDIVDQYTGREAICPADILIRNFEGSWNGDIRRAVDYLQLR